MFPGIGAGGSDRREASASGRAWALVLLLGLALHAPALFVAGYDGEEGRRVLQARGMLFDGEWIVPHIAGEPYLAKPPLYPWLIALSGRLHGELSPWLARLPSLLATLGIALVLLHHGTRLGGARAGVLAAFLWLVSPAAGEKAALAETDQVLVLGVLLATLPDRSFAGRAVAAAGLALALLVKGPPALVFVGAALAGTALVAGRRSVPWRGALVVGLLGCLPVAVWSVAALGGSEGAGSGPGWARELTGGGALSWRRYLLDRLDYAPGPLLAALPAVLLLPALLARRRDEPRLGALAVAVTLAYLFFLVYPRSEARYAYPAVPWLALAAGAHLARRAALPRAVRYVSVLALVVTVGRAVTELAYPGSRAAGPAIAAVLGEHLAPGETLYDGTSEHDVLALLDHPVRAVEGPRDVPPGGLLLTPESSPEDWSVLARFDEPALRARLVRVPATAIPSRGE